MSFVKDQDIFDATNGGLDIILAYYPNANKVITKVAKQFKLRESEKTASASLKLLQNGVWVVTDFGGDQTSRNGIQVCALEERISYGEACGLLGARYGVKGAELQVFKPIIEKRALKADEVPGTYSFVYKDFSEKESALLGPRVNKDHCEPFNLKSCESFSYVKDNEVITSIATEEYPILVFDFGEWQKIYQPNSFEKQFRFRYAGKKPSRHVFGMDLIKEEFNHNKAAQESDDDDYSIDDESDNGEAAKKKKKDPRVERAFIVSGGSDGINLYSFGEFPIWFNSESEHLDWEEYKLLKIWVKELYYIADLDATGVKQAIQMGLKFLDIKLLWLPEKLKTFKDKRGNPCKDFKDYVDKFYRAETSKSFTNGLDKLINNALPMQFWTEFKAEKKTNYTVSNTRLYHFLALMGIGRYENEALKDDFVYIQKDGNIIRVLQPYQIENYIHQFLEDRQMSPDLRDYVYKSPVVKKDSLTKLKKSTIDFTDADKHNQYLFFNKKVWKIDATGTTEYRQGEVEKYVWEDKIIDFDVKKEDNHFNISTDADGDLDIEIIKKDNPFLNYLINASRVHWKNELEDSFADRPEIEAEEYHKKNLFNIAGSRLSDDEIYEQKVHLINKIYTIGYLLHKYKDDSKPWCVFAMDNKISETGESHGGSGKSVCFSNLNFILKRRFYIKGRDPKVTQNDFIYHGVTEDTDYILIDDANQYLDFGFFYSEITGSLKVNPKNAQPYEIPFSKSPKFVITSNFTIKDDGPSTARRILFCSFSDYYHENKEGEYKSARNISDDFGGRNLFRDFTDAEWNAFYNFCSQALSFYLSHAAKINPPMDNVTKRSLRAEMGDAFEGWAEAYFATMEVSPGDLETEIPKYLDNYFSKEVAFEEFMKATSLRKWSPTKFKKAMKAYCQLNGYVFNPKDLQNNGGRIIQRIDGKSQEAIFIRTIPMPELPKESEVREYTSEDQIFNQ
jgi:ribosomal protein S18